MNTATANVIKVTFAELCDILENFKAAKGAAIFANFKYTTKPRTTKKDRETKEPAWFTLVTKQKHVYAICNASYERQVQNAETKQALKEHLADASKDETVFDFKSEFEAQAPVTPITTCANNDFFGWNDKNGKPMIKYRFDQSKKSTTTYFADGVECEKSKLVNFLDKERPMPAVPWNTLYVENIEYLSIGGQHYEVI